MSWHNWIPSKSVILANEPNASIRCTLAADILPFFSKIMANCSCSSWLILNILLGKYTTYFKTAKKLLKKEKKIN